MTDRRTLATLPDGSLFDESAFQAWLASWPKPERAYVRRLSTRPEHVPIPLASRPAPDGAPVASRSDGRLTRTGVPLEEDRRGGGFTLGSDRTSPDRAGRAILRATSRIPRRGASELGANPPGPDVRAPAPSAGRSTAGGTG